MKKVLIFALIVLMAIVLVACPGDKKTYNLLIIVHGKGTVVPDEGAHKYAEGTSVRITAQALNGWHFSKWSGNSSGDLLRGALAADNRISINGDEVITAIFEKNDYELDITVNPGGAGYVDQEILPNNQGIKLSAVANTGYVFDHWGGDIDGNNNTAIINMNTEKSVTAYYKELTYNLYISISPSSSGKVDRINLGDRRIGLKATPLDGYIFDHWEGDYSGTIETATIMLDRDKSVTAVFMKKETCSLTLSTNPGQSGWIIVEPEGLDLESIEPDQEVTLNAKPESGGWLFDHWEGDLTGNDARTTIYMSGDKNVTAIFRKMATYTLEIATSPTAKGNVITYPSRLDQDFKTLKQGQQIKLSAEPGTGMIFDHWEGDLTGNDNPVIITMDDNKKITAVFVTYLQGKIVGRETGRGVKGVTVSLYNQPYNFFITSTTTNSQGYWSVKDLPYTVISVRADCGNNYYCSMIYPNCVDVIVPYGDMIKMDFWGLQLWSVWEGAPYLNYYGIAFSEDNNSIYVTEDSDDCIYRFDKHGRFRDKWGRTGQDAGNFNDPKGIAVDDAGNVYVADKNNKRIQKLSGEGRYITQWDYWKILGGFRLQFGAPTGIAVGDGSGIYVTDTYKSLIFKLNENTKLFPKTWQDIASPCAIAADNSYLYISDKQNIYKVTLDMKEIWSKKIGSSVTGIAVSGPYLYVVEYDKCRIQILDKEDGSFINRWGSKGTAPGMFRYPYGIAIDNDGIIYVTDKNRIQVFKVVD